MLQGCYKGKEMYKRTWCTGKFIVLSIKTFYFFAVLLLSLLSLVVWSSSISATMVTWHHTSLYCLVSLLLQKQFACKFGAKLLPKNAKHLFLSSSCSQSLKNTLILLKLLNILPENTTQWPPARAKWKPLNLESKAVTCSIWPLHLPWWFNVLHFHCFIGNLIRSSSQSLNSIFHFQAKILTLFSVPTTNKCKIQMMLLLLMNLTMRRSLYVIAMDKVIS